MSKKVGNKYEYFTKQKLGAGGFAEVFKGKNRLTGEEVAIKVIKKDVMEKYGDEMLQQIHREIGILQQLYDMMKNDICPFINKIYECLETSNSIYIVLEFCDGGTLQQYKKKQPIPEDEALFILYQLVNALDFLARNNVAHRDIKPDNVFIKNGVFKLGDFGFAGQKSLYQTHLGTYPYMAPEFFLTNEYDGNQVDIWALGILFHEILFNEIYYMGTSQYDVQNKIINKPYVIGPNLKASQQVKDLLPLMIQKDPKLRITAQQLLQHPIFEDIKNDQRFLNIIENEKRFWNNNELLNEQPNQVKEANDQKQELDRQEQERLELEKQKERLNQQELQNQQQQYLDEQIRIIFANINQMRNSVQTLVYICSYLQQNFLEITRYTIISILKQAMVQITRMKEMLDAGVPFSQSDYIGFQQLDPNIWAQFYNDSRHNELADLVDLDRNIMRKNYIDYYNYITTHTCTYHPENIDTFQQYQHLDFQNFVDDALYEEQIVDNIQFLKADMAKVKEDQFKDPIKLGILILFTALQFKILFNGSIDVSQYLQATKDYNIQMLRQLLIK